MLATAVTTASPHLIEQAMTGANRSRSANRSQVCAPADMFRTSDGEILVQVMGEPMFKRWVGLAGEPGMLDDPRFTDDETRATHGETLSARMQGWCDGKSTEEALALLEEARIPAAPVLSLQQTLDDPHIAANGCFSLSRCRALQSTHRSPPRRSICPRPPAPSPGARPRSGSIRMRSSPRSAMSTEEIATLRGNGAV